MADWLQKFTKLFGSSGHSSKSATSGQQRNRDVKTIIYLHMAKTGGATLGDVLNRQFPTAEIIFPGKMDIASAMGLLPQKQVIRRFQSISSKQWSAARLVPGHFMFGVHKSIPVPTSYLTMLRHPVSRVISSYYYILEQPGIPVREKIIRSELDLAAYVKSGLGLDPHNYQTRVLAGLPEYDAAWETTANVLKRDLPESVLELVLRNIENHIPYLGITERFDEFLLLLKLTFGWPLERILYRRINETRSKPSIKDIPEETIRMIETHNSLDLRLYDFAKLRFEKWIGQHETAIEYLLPRFRELNMQYQESALDKNEMKADISDQASRIEAGIPKHSC